ncbi:tripartite motif-containing protein 3-like [Lytechinus variegatus]|uniref:tripartite motif-containing protein 3-like n=1 Tax=Lytechinus variegatus TaxID=7654 RepID=UPI001BB25607|nr:tripartite motif-containing protein 3-like [Lytechinus variegatus]
MAEEIKRLLECPMCLELFTSSSRKPKLLPCQHTLCLECMDMLQQGNRIQCPQCRQEHTCPADGPAQLPNNFTMLALLDVQQKSSPSPTPVSMKESSPPVPARPEPSRPPAINEGVRNSIALLARKLQEKSVELSRIDNKEKQTEDLFLSIKNKVDSAFEARTRDLQTRRDQLIKQLASARQEELAFIQGQRASAYQYLQKLQTDFSKMRHALTASAEPREADLINLLSLCRGYLSQIEQYALNIDQRICNVAFTDPNQQQLSISIQAYGCLNISTDKAKSVQAVRPTMIPSATVSQSSPSNPFDPARSFSATTSSTSSSPTPGLLSQGSSAPSSGDGFSQSPYASASSPAVTPVTPVTPDVTSGIARQHSRANRRLSEPLSQPAQPTLSAGIPAPSQSVRLSRHMSMDAVGATVPVSTSQPNPAPSDQPPPIPRRPGTSRLSSVGEQPSVDRPRSILLRQHTVPSAISQTRGDAPPLPPRSSVQVSSASVRSSITEVPSPQSSANTNNPSQPWVTFTSNGAQSSSASQKQRVSIIGQLFERPVGVHVVEKLNNCFAVVDELEHCVMIINEEGRLLRKMGSKGAGAGQMQFPKGICSNSSGHIIITDSFNHKIQVWEISTGRCLKQFGSRGHSNYCFDTPMGVVCDKQDNIYVCDYNNGCVKVFNPMGQFLRQIGKKGERDGQFRNPAYIAFTQGGELLITDAFKHCVQVFSSQGTYLYRFGRWGTSPGDLNCPSGITVDSQGYIYVANRGNHRIEVFNPSGSYALNLGRHGTEEGQLDEPLGVSVTKDGRLLVSDSGNRRLQLLWP